MQLFWHLIEQCEYSEHLENKIVKIYNSFKFSVNITFFSQSYFQLSEKILSQAFFYLEFLLSSFF